MSNRSPHVPGGAGIPPEQLPSLAATLKTSGRTVSYLGPTARGLALNSFADILATPSFLAAYGTCDPGDEGGRTEPVLVFTAPWEPEPAGYSCRPLESQLALVTQLRPLDAAEPARRLPPPDPPVVAWIARTCSPGTAGT